MVFSEQVIVVVCDHFFDGTPENRHLLEHTYARHPRCQFIEFAYLPDRLYSQYHPINSQDPDWAFFLCASARYIAFPYLKPEIESVLFLDSDEIVEGSEFLKWLQTGEHGYFEALRLAAYLYGLKPNMRAKKVVNLPLFVKKKSFASLTCINELDRMGAFFSHLGPKRERVVGLKGLPMIHHYSWTRTKDEALQKAKTWGHRNDENWPLLIEEAFNGDVEKLFQGHHTFEKIENCYFDPFQVESPEEKAKIPGSHVLKIDERSFRIKEIEYALL